jgi:hypothetical protein
MGSMQAMEMAEMLDIDSALSWHLRANHYPPVPLSMVEPCKEAIQAGLEEDWHRLIHLNGTSWRGQDSAPAHAIIEAHHLDAWLELDEEVDEDWLMGNS